MIASANGIGYLKRERWYEIPFFQRGYVWDVDNWEEFWNSLIDSVKTQKTAFLGSIIIKDTSRKKWDKSIYSVIDGQQRLTTISIFVKAFLDEKKSQNDRTVHAYNDTLFVYENHTGDNKNLKICHSRIDREEFGKCINSSYTDYENIENDSKIFRCYKFFREQLKKMNDENIIEGFQNLILDTESEAFKIFVMIEIDAKENEQKIFDTVNSSGVKLTSADIIKNALFERMMSVTNEHGMVVEYYEATWNKTFSNDEDTLKYWEKETVSGRLKRKRIEVLLHSVAVIKGVFEPQTSKIEDLPNEFKKHISGMDLAELKDFIHEICEFASLYREKFIEFDDQAGYSFNLDNREDLFHKNLDLLNISTFDSYILKLYYENKKGSISKESMLENFVKLEKYVVRTLLSYSDNKKNFNKNNADLLVPNSSTTIDSLLTRDDISDRAFASGLKNIKSNLYGKVVLFMIELNRIKESRGGSSHASLPFVYTLEHVMPRAYYTNWGFEAVPVIDDLGNQIVDSIIQRETREKAIYEIGNMTLLTQGLNSRVGNNSFEIKKNGLKVGNNVLRGLKDFSQLSISLQVLNAEVWNESTIRKRTLELTKEIMKIW